MTLFFRHLLRVTTSSIVSSFSLVTSTSFNIITSQNLKKHFYLAKIKRKTPLNSSSKISQSGLFYKGKFETEARILAMRLALRGCWRPCYSRKFFCYFCIRYYVNFTTGMQSKIASSIRVKSRYRIKL